MLTQYKTYLHNHDLYTKFPTLHPYNSLKLNSVKFIVSSNSLPANSKLFYLLSNLSQSITGQVPAIIKAKKSVASFKLRKNSPMAIYTTLRKQRASTFLNLLTLFYIPQLISLNPKYRFPCPQTTHFSRPLPPKGDSLHIYSSLYSFGFNDISYFTHIHPLASQPTLSTAKSTAGSNKKGSLSNNSSFGFKQIGGYVQFNITPLSNHHVNDSPTPPSALTSSDLKEKLTPHYFYITQILSYPFS